MRTTRTTSTSPRAFVKPVRTSSEGLDAITLLTEDHENVRSLFDAYEGLADRAHASKQKLAIEICDELTKHAIAEEEIFYPAVRKASIDNEDLIDEAIVEHASAKDLIAQILAMAPGDALFDATVTVLSEQIQHHVEEEEGEIFPRARKAKLNLLALGQAIAERKSKIKGSPSSQT